MQPVADSPFFDAIVMGAGITGIYQLYRLRELGFSVRGYEAGGDVGGTWYFNRYPGCRLDTESYAYSYFAQVNIVPEWSWSERFATQPEILEYVNLAADKMDVRKDYQFNTRVKSAEYNERDNLWEVDLDDGSRTRCRYLISAVGLLSEASMPNIEGVNTFAGLSLHSAQWPRDPNGGYGPENIDFSGKRVGVIGTGSTGIQIIPTVAETAREVMVFQRTPNWAIPLGNEPLSPEEMESVRQNYDGLLDYLKTTDGAFPHHRVNQKGIDATPEERKELFERLYKLPGYALWLGSYRDMLTNKETNSYLTEFIADKIRSRVKDQSIAEKLIPKDHPIGGKRVPMETNYYETYNRDNVELINVRETPIVKITPDGIETSNKLYDLDVIIYATGFDAITGAIDAIDIRGIEGKSLKEVWKNGPLSYLGLQVTAFPNFFILVGPHSGSAFCNNAVCGGLQVDWLTKMLRDMRNRGLSYSEPEASAQTEWTQNVLKDFDRTLLAGVDAWWVKTVEQPDGTVTRIPLVYVNGGPAYRKICDQVAYYDYQGFVQK